MVLSLLLATTLASDSLVAATRVVVAPAETLTVATRGSGPPVVLFNGIVGSAWTWRHVVGELNARGHRTIVIEPLGMGLSSRPEKADYSLTAQAKRIAAVMDSLEVGPAIVVSHGLAGSMALRLAVHRADLVSGVVSLEGGPAERAATKGFRNAMRYVPWVKFFGGVRRVRSQMAKSMRKSSGDPSWVTDEVVAHYTAGAAADLDATLKAYLQIADAKEPERLGPRLEEIQCPVVLLQGMAEHDGSVGQAEVDLLKGSVRRFTTVPVPGAGHYLQEEQPGAVVRAILALSKEVVAVRE